MFENSNSLVNVRVMGDPVLRTRCREVSSFGAESIALAEKLAHGLQMEKSGIGIAANQIGIGLRAFHYDLREASGEERKDFHGTIFNPAIVEWSGGSYYREGCLSIPGLFWDIYRPEKVLVEGFDLYGKEVVFHLDGLAARLFQHEVDHLDGLLILDRIPDREERRSALLQAQKLLGGTPKADSADVTTSGFVLP